MSRLTDQVMPRMFAIQFPFQSLGLISKANCEPYDVGVQLGAVWEQQTIQVELAGNLADSDARAILVTDDTLRNAADNPIAATCRQAAAHSTTRCGRRSR